jgi:coatomer subunit beta
MASYSLVHHDGTDVASMSDLRTQLEKGTDESKVETMKKILTIMLNGDPMPVRNQLVLLLDRLVNTSSNFSCT